MKYDDVAGIFNRIFRSFFKSIENVPSDIPIPEPAKSSSSISTPSPRAKPKIKSSIGNLHALSDFEKAVTFVLKKEGGYVNDPRDPGGETKFGISKRSYPDVDIKNMTVTAAKQIYYTDYWQIMKCDDMLWPLNLIVFDTAVNMGVGRAKQFLIKSGMSGNAFLDIRESFYRAAKNHNIYLKGWLNRLNDLRKEANL